MAIFVQQGKQTFFSLIRSLELYTGVIRTVSLLSLLLVLLLLISEKVRPL